MKFSIFAAVAAVLAGAKKFKSNAGSTAGPPPIEVGTFAMTTGRKWESVTFRGAFSAAPVVVVMPTTDGGNPCTIYITNVTATGFEAAPAEPYKRDGPHPAWSPETISYIAVAPGTWELGGKKVVAGKKNTKIQKYNNAKTTSMSGDGGWDSVTLGDGFPEIPALLTQIQTTNNNANFKPIAYAKPFLVVACQSVSKHGASVALERLEVANYAYGNVTKDETIGWIGIEAGTGSFRAPSGSNVTFSSLATAPVFRGWDNSAQSVAFGLAGPGFPTSSPLVVASQMSRNGNNGGWLRLKSRSKTSVKLVVDEDNNVDTERNHVKEAAGIFAVSAGFYKPTTTTTTTTTSVTTTTTSATTTTTTVTTTSTTATTATTTSVTTTTTSVTTETSTTSTTATTTSATTTTTSVTTETTTSATTTTTTVTTTSTTATTTTATTTSTTTTTAPTSIEVGTFVMTTGRKWESITFSGSFSAAPVVVVMPTTDGGNPCTIYITNVTATGFEAAPAEPYKRDGPHPAWSPETISYIAVATGTWELGGKKVVAGKKNTKLQKYTDAKTTSMSGDGEWDSVTLGGGFPEIPALLTQIQTTNNNANFKPTAYAKPFLVVACQSVSKHGASVALERLEVANYAYGNVTKEETIGWIGIEAGTGAFLAPSGRTLTFSSLATAPLFRGWDNSAQSVGFGLAGSGFPTSSPLVVASKMSRNGNNGGWLRLKSRSKTSVKLVVDEDNNVDRERSHVKEGAGIFAVSAGFHIR